MRLLKRDQAGGVSFTKDLSEDELSGPHYRYAILSHRWGKQEEEVTYKDILNGIGTIKPGVGAQKIRFCVEQTRQDGLEYFWLDTCCIDKSKDAELSRALRSMFRWYTNSEKCYVYLLDVSHADWEREFRQSTWFKRGWTLQELLAPSKVYFYTNDDRYLGTRASLEQQINEVTHIPIEALRGQALTTFSMQERRQWQKGRTTQEPEDMVYSLFGIFDVSMPVLYGEGLYKAQQRLDHEISVAQRGPRYKDFSLSFSLAEAAVETQHFVARNGELREMREKLTSDGSRRVVVIHGLGGMGKTQLAMAYAKRHKDDYTALLWLNATDEDTIKSSFAKVARQIMREQLDITSLTLDRNLDEVVDGVKTWLNKPMNTRWLMICDNYDNPKVSGNTDPTALDLCRFLPTAYQGSVIVTTRSAEVKLGHCIRLQKLAKFDSLKILEDSSDRKDLQNDCSAIELVQRVDGLPLALATAGAYLCQSAITFTKYLDLYTKSWARLQQKSRALMTYEDRTLFTTWQVSFDQIERKNSNSAQLLRLWAYFDNKDLWYELLNHVNDESPTWLINLVSDELEFEESIQVLCDHGLVEANASNPFEIESGGYSVHACVHAWMSAVLNAQGDERLARAAFRCVALHMPEQEAAHRPLVQRRMLNHVNRCVSTECNKDDKVIYQGYYHFGNLYADLDKLSEAEQMYKRALVGYEEVFGADHTMTLGIINNLGLLYTNSGRYAEAELMYERALEGYEKVSKDDDSLTLDTVNNLGILYADQGNLSAAELMYHRALVGYKSTLGPDHAYTLGTVYNLAILYKSQGRLEEAEKMCEQALMGKEKALGADHKSTLSTVKTLGNIYVDQDRLEEAEKMYKRALAGEEKMLGTDHRSTLASAYNLGLLYKQQGRLEEAQQFYVRALTGYERTLGADHTSTLTTVNNLGSLYKREGKLVEAGILYERALAGFEKTLGIDHESTIDTIYNYGILYETQGKLDEAEKMYKRALAGYEKTLGADHAYTFDSVICLSHLHISQDKIQEAEELYLGAKAREDRMNPRLQGHLENLRKRLHVETTAQTEGSS